jgi:O-antigen/teichoic acid export membrane protein
MEEPTSPGGRPASRQPSTGRFGLLAALPAGTIPVALGLVVSGFATYAFQIIAFRSLGAEPYAALNGLWVIAFILAPGLFLPLEQEVARALAHRRARGEGGRPLLMKAAGLGLGLTVGVVALLFAFREPIEQRLLRSDDRLFAALVAVLIGWALMSLARGALSGNARFGRYAIVVGVDGLSRAVGAAALVIVGYTTLGWFGVVFALAPYAAIVFGLAGARRLAIPGPPARMSELSTAMGWLLLGSTSAQALSYSAYVGASLLATPAQNAELGAFVAALFIARIPLLLFQAVQAALLPRLAGLLSQNRLDEFRHGFGRLLGVVVALSAVGSLLALVAGPMIGRLLFGAGFTISGPALASLTAGVCLVVIGLTLAQALIALRRYAIAPIAWIVGVGVFLLLLLGRSGDVFARAEAAFAVASAVVALGLAVATWMIIRRMSGAAVEAGSS